ncbi:hemerythrin domain-containing protein [Pullulanibacillus sp. KACC 23026]|uniref:hemerythrin domain-containing protein n=1 Tax=Pullulanibacillus sp. KACC 23026 TaxID=3028315 RepID=UPI0023AEFD21|nr:hemerythrin domain-containing protein [Pullulanibacillus sp. KACC 23026]WEG13803.1 hemerythrin domain-containing protein [Pullulanibacillus sp. KACC 23026]
MEKRHKALIPLSHHHHHGLVIALKLQEVVESGGRWPKEQVFQDAKLFWESGGEEHFREEENVLYPTFSKYASIESLPEMAEALLEHIKMRGLFSQLIHHEVSDELSLMHELGALLKKHIQSEERIIFPLIQEKVPENVLLDISLKFSPHDEFLKDE